VRADQCASRCTQVIDVLDAEAKKIGGADFLAQGKARSIPT
jgi:GMP synthase PP-ATPase subunit